MKDLDDKGLVQNKVLCSYSGVKLPMVKLPLQALQRSLHQEDRFLASRRLLAVRTTLTQILPYRLFLVASSLSPLLCRLFLVAFSLSPLLYCLFLVASFLSPHLVRVLARPDGHPCFCFAGSWVVGLAMGGAESRGADVNIGFFGWSF